MLRRSHCQSGLMGLILPLGRRVVPRGQSQLVMGTGRERAEYLTSRCTLSCGFMCVPWFIVLLSQGTVVYTLYIGCFPILPYLIKENFTFSFNVY